MGLVGACAFVGKAGDSEEPGLIMKSQSKCLCSSPPRTSFLHGLPRRGGKTQEFRHVRRRAPQAARLLEYFLQTAALAYEANIIVHFCSRSRLMVNNKKEGKIKEKIACSVKPLDDDDGKQFENYNNTSKIRVLEPPFS